MGLKVATVCAFIAFFALAQTAILPRGQQQEGWEDNKNSLQWNDRNARQNIDTHLHLILDKVVQGIAAQKTDSRSARSISSQQRRDAQGPLNERDLTNLLRDMCPKVADEIKSEVPALFSRLVWGIRGMDYQQLVRVHDQLKGQSLCSSDKLMDLWLDALAADASAGSVKLMVKLIERNEVSPLRINYFLSMLSFAKVPTREAVQSLVSLLQKADVPRQALLGTSALINGLVREEGPKAAEYREVKEATQAILNIIKENRNNQRQLTKAIAGLKALKNIGLIGSDATQEVIKMALGQNNEKQVIRVEAIEALAKESRRSIVQEKMWEILRNQMNPSEVRIASYKTLIRSADSRMVTKVIDMLRERDLDIQVGSFIGSHLENLQETSDPEKMHLKEMLRSFNVPTQRYMKDIRKYSRYFEGSNFVDQLGFGAVSEAELIYDRSFAPRSIKANLTLPVFGKHVNLIEVGLRQVGLEDQIEKMVGPEGLLNQKEKMPEMMAGIFNIFQEKSNEIRNNRIYRRDARIEQNLEAQAYLKVDGKTVLYLDMEDVKEVEQRDITNFIDTLKEKVGRGYYRDHAFAFQLIDSTLEIPSTEGPNMRIDLNGTVVLGHKGADNLIWPSIALELESKANYYGRDADKKNGVRMIQTISAAPALKYQVEQKNGRPVKVLLSLPRDQMEVFSYQSKAFLIDNKNKVEKEIKTPSLHQMDGCFRPLERYFGLEICSKMASPKPFYAVAPWTLDLIIKKADRSIRGWEWTLEIPTDMRTDSQQSYRIGYNTPGSRINREVALEVDVSAPSNGPKEVTLKMKSPAKTIEAVLGHKWDQTEYNTKVEVTVDRRDRYAFEAGLEQDIKGKKAEWKPKLRIEGPHMRPIQLGGSVTIDQGRKSQVAFDLHSNEAQNQKQFFKGSLVKEGSLDLTKDFRVSSDLQGDIGFITFRLFGMAEKQAMSLATDMKVEYQRPNARKHNVRLVSKVQNLSTQSLTKVNSFVELQMSQFPANNFHLSWNVQRKAQEHVENEVTLMWKDQMKDPQRRIHLLQVTKFTGLRGARTATVENLISLEVAPLSINYELKGSGHFERGETPKFRFEVDAADKNSRGKKEIRSAFGYQHISRKPLKIAMDALVKIPSREVKYSDQLEEVAPNEYKGKTQFQWDQDKKTTIDYTYRMKSDNRKAHHEIDVELKTPSMRYGSQHQALLRMTRDELEVRSKAVHERNNIWDFAGLYSKVGRSNVNVETNSFGTKFEINPFAQTKVAALEIQGKSFPLSHQSSLELNHQTQTLISKTVYNQKPYLTINAHRNRDQMSRINVGTQQVDLRMDSNHGISPKTASLEIRSKRQVGSHKTSLSYGSDKVDLRSKTEMRGQILANVEATLSPRMRSYINIDVPQVQGQAEFIPRRSAKVEVNGKANYGFAHKTEVNFEDRESLIGSSSTKVDNVNVADFQGIFNPTGKSSAKMTTSSFRGNVEVDPFSTKKALKVQFDDMKEWEHNTDASLESSKWMVSSLTKRAGQRYALLDGVSDRQRSSLKMSAPRGEATLEMIPKKTMKVELKCNKVPNLYHKTVVAYEPEAIVLSSRTDRDNKQVANIESRLTRNERSIVKIDSLPASGNFELDMSRPTKTMNLEVQGKNNQVQHKTLVSCNPREGVFEMSSSTHKRGNSLLDVQSKINRRDVSQLKVQTPEWNGNVEANLYNREKTMKIEGSHTKKNVAHKTQVTYSLGRNAALKVASETKTRGQKVVDLETEIRPAAHSFVRINSQHVDVQGEFNPHQSPVTAKWNFAQKKGMQVVHDGQMTFSPRKVSILSETKTGMTRPFALVDSVLSRDEPSYIKVQTTPYEAEMRANLMNRSKDAKISILSQKHQVAHKTDLTWDRDSFSFDSETQKRSRPVLSIQSKVQPKDQSYLKVYTQSYQGEASFDNQAAAKKVKLIGLNKVNGLDHETTFTYQPARYVKVASKTNKARRSLLTVDSEINRQGKSFFNLGHDQVDASIEISPFDSLKKSARWNFEAKQHRVGHMANIEWNRDNVDIRSETKKNNRPLVTIVGGLSRQNKSHLRVSTQEHNGLFEIQPFATKKSALLNLNIKNQFDHESNVAIDKKSISLKTLTKRSNGQSLLDLDSLIHRQQRSYVDAKTPMGNIAFEVEHAQPKKSLKLNLKGDEYVHSTTAESDLKDGLFLTSSTKKNGKQMADVFAKINRRDLSQVKVTSPSFKYDLQVDPNQKYVKLNGEAGYYQHETAYNWSPNNWYELKSTTKNGNKALVEVDTKYNHRGQDKSHLKIVTQQADTTFELDHNNQIKEAKVTFSSKQSKSPLFHQSSLLVEPKRRIAILSETRNGRDNILKVQADLKKDQKSTLGYQSDRHQIQVEVNPFDRIKSAKVSFDHLKRPLTHYTLVESEPTKMRIESRTTESNRPVAKVDATLSRVERSHVDIMSDAFNAKGEVTPFGAEKNLSWDIRGKQIPLMTEARMTLNSNRAMINSKAQWDGQHVFEIDSDLNRQLVGNNYISLKNRLFDGKVELGQNNNLFKVDYNAKHMRPTRRIQGQVDLSSPKGYLAELKWDADRDSNKALVIAAKTQRNQPEVEIRFGDMFEGKVVAEMNNDLVSGPHKVEVTFRKGSTPRTIFIHHEIVGQQIRCQAKYLVNGIQKVSLVNNGKYERTSNGIILDASLTSQNEYNRQFDNVQVAISHRHSTGRNSFESNTEMRGQLQTGKVYNSKVTFFQQTSYGQGKVSIKGSLQTPISQYANQEGEATLEWNKQSASFLAAGKTAAGKRFEARAESALQRDATITSAELKVDRDVQIKIKTEVNKDLMNGPHDMQLTLKQGSNSVPRTVQFHHQVVANKEIQFQIKYLVDGVQKMLIENRGMFEQSRDGLKLVAGISMKDQFRYLDGFQLGINHEQKTYRGTYEISTELKGQVENGQTYISKVDLIHQKITRDAGKIIAKVALQTPLYDFSNQDLELRADYNRDQATIQVTGKNARGKQLQGKADLTLRPNGATASAEIKSDFPSLVPAMKMEGNVHVTRTNQAISYSLDVNRQRKVNFEAGFDFENLTNFNGKATMTSAFTPRLDAIIVGQYQGDHMRYEVVAKKDQVEMFATKMIGQKKSFGWKIDGSLSNKGSLLGQIDLENKATPASELVYEMGRQVYRFWKKNPTTAQKQYVLKMKAPLSYEHIQSMWNQPIFSRNNNNNDQQPKYNSFSDKMTSFKANLLGDWTAPYKTQAHLVGGQHLVTFDRKFYDFAGQDCNYVLAKDAVNGDFSVVAKYQGTDRNGKVKKSILVNLKGNKQVEINTETNTILLDGQIVEAPIFLESATILRKGNSILVDNKRGFNVECHLKRDICSLTLPSWYFGKTGGLMGSFDNDDSNDMITADRRQAKTVEDFAQSWQHETTCRSQNVARSQEAREGSAAFEECRRHFVDERSALRSGFGIVDPEPFFRMCLRHVQSAAKFEQPEKAICTIANAYVSYLRSQNVHLNLPTQCLACGEQENIEFGSRTKVHRPYGADKKADVVFIIEEATCNRNIVKEMDGMTRLIERELNQVGFNDNKYSVVGFSGKNPHVHTARGKVLFNVNDIVLATQRMEFDRLDSYPDTFEALAFASQEIPFRSGSSKNVILMTCNPCDEKVNNRLDYSDLQRMLLAEGITLHVMNDKAIEIRNSPAKSRGLFAADHKTVYRNKDFSQKRLEGQEDLRSQVILPKDVCVALAQETRGSFFTTQPLFQSQESKQWRSLLARRVVESAEPSACQTCDCLLDGSQMNPRTVCRPCKAAQPAQVSKFSSYSLY